MADMGRPKKAKSDLHGEALYVRFTKEDRKQLEEAADKTGQSITQWAREVLKKAAARVLKSDTRRKSKG